MVVGVVVFSVSFYVLVANIRTNAMKMNKRAIGKDHGTQITALRDESAALQKDINTLRK